MTTIKGKGAPKAFMLDEGEHVLHVSKVQGIPRANVTTVTMEMVDKDGVGFKGQYPQKYDLTSDGGYAAFYYLLKNCYGIDLNEGDEFDIDQLEDTFVTVDIVHNKGKKPKKAALEERPDGPFSPDDYPTFANIGRAIGPGEPFDTPAVEADADADDEDEI